MTYDHHRPSCKVQARSSSTFHRFLFREEYPRNADTAYPQRKKDRFPLRYYRPIHRSYDDVILCVPVETGLLSAAWETTRDLGLFSSRE